jgi:hypothetical protein
LIGEARIMRKYHVKVNLKKPSRHPVRRTVTNSIELGLEREFKILANNVRDAKIRARTLLAKEGYDEKLLQHAIWTVSQLDYTSRKHKGPKQQKE